MKAPFTIGLIEDDDGMRRALRRLLVGEGFEVRDFRSPADFFENGGSRGIDCLLLDLSLPGMSGIELQALLNRENERLPVIFLTGEGDIPTSVSAMKAGAVDFLTKPVEEDVLFRVLEEALKNGKRRRQEEGLRLRERELLEALSPRELEILRHVITGKLNKQIAADLGISEQTVKVHRMRIAGKTGLPSVAEWVRLAERNGIVPVGADGN